MVQPLQRGIKVLLGIVVVSFLPWGIRQIQLHYYWNEKNEQVVYELIDRICEKGYMEEKDYIDLTKQLLGNIKDVEITEVIKREARQKSETYEYVNQWEIERVLERDGYYQFTHGSTLIVQIVLENEFGRFIGRRFQSIRYVGRIKSGAGGYGKRDLLQLFCRM